MSTILPYPMIRLLMLSFAIAISPTAAVVGQSLLDGEGDSREPFADIPLYELGPKEDADSRLDATTQPKTTPWSEEAARAFREVTYVNDLGDPRKLIFEGVSLFEEAQLRLALAFDVRYQAAARPSNETSNFLETLEERLLEGYRHSGCPDAKVTARRDSDRGAIVVQVEEGPRYKMGEIRVSGSKQIDERALAKWLTTPQRARPWEYGYGREKISTPIRNLKSQNDPDSKTYWCPGASVGFTDAAKEELEIAVQIALAELGFGRAKFHVDFAANPGEQATDFVITVDDEVPACRIDRIEIVGLKRDSRKALLHYLGIGTGDRLDADVLNRVYSRLSDSCRYWRIGIHVLLPERTKGHFVPVEEDVVLWLNLDEYEPAPPLSEPLSAVDDALIKAAKWLETVGTPSNDKDLVCTFESPDTAGESGNPCNWRLIISREGVLADLKYASDKGWSFDHAVAVSGNTLLAVDRKSRERLDMAIPGTNTGLKSVFGIQPTLNEDGTYSHNLKLGSFLRKDQAIPTAGGTNLAVHVEPLALVCLAHRQDTQATIKDGVLLLTSSSHEYRIDASTGEFLHFKVWHAERQSADVVSVRMEEFAWQKAVAELRKRSGTFPNMVDEQRPVTSLADFALRQIAAQPRVQQQPVLAILLVQWSKVLVNSHIESNLKGIRLGSSTELHAAREATFEIPGIEPASDSSFAEFVQDVFPWIPLIADEAFPRGSWPWTLSREACFLMISHKQDATVRDQLRDGILKEVQRLHESHELGPVGVLLVAPAVPNVLRDYPAKAAAVALADLSDEAFLKDVRLLTGGDRWLTTFARAAAVELGNLPEDEQNQLIQALPEKWRDPLQRLVARRREFPNEPVDDAIEAALLQSWHTGLRDVVEANLRTLSASTARTDEVDAAINR